MDIIKKLSLYKAIPIVTVTEQKTAQELFKYLKKNSLPVVEITLRDSRVKKALKDLDLDKILLGIGTIKNLSDIDTAIDAKANFGVSPGLNIELSEYAGSKNFLLIPGVDTASEVMQALSYGHKLLKFFPAEYAGGIEKLKAFNSVFPEAKFIPTGGINLSNMKSYLELDNVVAVGSSALISINDFKENNLDLLNKNLETLKKI